MSLSEPSIAISVIMPVYNGKAYLAQCLESFKAQSFDDWELLCVDRGSTDGTLSILESYAKDWPKLKILDGGNERTSQINIGVRNSRGKYIYYTACDFDVDRTLLAEAFEAAERDQSDAVFIDCLSHGDHFWARVRRLERTTYLGSGKFEAARFFRRASYMAVGGYDDAVPIFEEYDLQDRLIALGATFSRISAVERHLGEPMTLKEIWKKSYYYGRRYRDLVRKQGATALRHANPMRATFIKHWRSFAASPVLTLGFVVMVFTKYAAGALGLTVQTLSGVRKTGA